jgi:quinol monooxygenase YgiN
MRDEIYCLCTCAVKPGKFEEFESVVAKLVAMTKTERGSLAYDYSYSDDKSTVQVFESYKDSLAVVEHVEQTFSNFTEAFLDCVDLTSYVVYGTPDAAAREILDGLGSTYMNLMQGYTHNP